MNEQFDRTLRNHIKDTFDHYDDLMADDGWNKFKKQKNRKKRGLIFWYALPSGIAAALALLWIFNLTTVAITENKNDNIAQSSATKNQPNKNSSIIKESILNNDSSIKVKGKEIALKSNEFAKPLAALSSNKPYLIGSSLTQNRAQILPIEVQQISFAGFNSAFISQRLAIVEKGLMKYNSKITANQELLAFNYELLHNTSDKVNPEPKTKEKLDQKKDNNKFNFSVDANTYYSFTAAGVSNDLDVGIGFLSELKLSNRLSVNSGISLNQQSALYQNSQQNLGSQFLERSASPDASSSTLSTQSISIPESVSTNAKLVGFDIPLNLKYNIPLGRAKTFVSTGISSYSVLNQNYTNDVSVVNYSLTSAPQTSVLRNIEQEKDGAFSNFQFARTINFSFGILYPVSTKNSISVEPFVKYPIAGFGNRDLEIGSGGISFKLNFGR